MKITIAGPILDGTGYSEAIVNYALALDKVGEDVACIQVQMTPTQSEVPSKIHELLKKKHTNPDVIIQHNLPETFSKFDGVKNVGMYAYEASGINTTWKYHCELMDKIIVFNKSQSNQDNYAEVIPHAITLYEEELNDIELGLDIDNTYKFYTISEHNSRKNIEGLVLAYIGEFSCQDNVSLIIKTNNGDGVKKLIQNVKMGLKRYRSDHYYPPVVVIDQKLSRSYLASLHNYCNTFVSASRGEAFCYPFVDAMSFGNLAIVPDHTAFQDYQRAEDSYFLASNRQTRCFSPDTRRDLYTGDEYWHDVDTADLGNLMRSAYDAKIPKSEDRKKYAIENFNLQTIGQKLQKALS